MPPQTEAFSRTLIDAQLKDQGRGLFQTGNHRLGIDAPSKPVLCIRGDGELATRLSRNDRIEPGAFNKDVGGGLITAG